MKKQLRILFVCFLFQNVLVLSKNNTVIDIVDQCKSWYSEAFSHNTLAAKMRAYNEYLRKKSEYELQKAKHNEACQKRDQRIREVATLLSEKESDQSDQLKQAIAQRVAAEAEEQIALQHEQQAFVAKQRARDAYVQVEKPAIAHAAEIAIPTILGAYLYRNAVARVIVQDGVKYVYKAGLLKKNFLRLAIPVVMLQGYVRSEILDRDTKKSQREMLHAAANVKARELAEDIAKAYRVEIDAKLAQSNQERDAALAKYKQVESESRKVVDTLKQEESMRAAAQQESTKFEIENKELHTKNDNLQSLLDQRNTDLDSKNKIIQGYRQEYAEKGFWHRLTGEPWSLKLKA